MLSVPALVARLYPRLGRRYLDAVLPPMLLGSLGVGLAGTSALVLYIDTSLRDFLILLATVLPGFWLVDTLIALRLARRRLVPVYAWLDGRRDDRTTVQAWRAAATLPFELARHRPFYVFVALAAPVWDAFAVRLLDLPAYAMAALIAGNVMIYAYWLVLRFLAVERVLRPVLEDIAVALPQNAVLPATTVSLRARLLGSVPALLVITGAIAAGLAARVDDELTRLGLGLGAAVVVAFSIGGGVLDLLADSIASPMTRLREATQRVARGDFGVRVPVATTDETGELARSFNRMVEGLEERERLRETLGAYVDPGVAEHILREGTNLGGEEVEVTVMFLDVRDFTGFAERVDAERVVAALNALWGCAVPIVHEHAGHVDKFVGDGLLAVFGAPRRCEDHADQALAAAVEIVAAVVDDPAIELTIGIGLNTGSVVAGNVGGAGRLEFSVIGDAVNVAARVEAATRETGDAILVTDATRRALERPGATALEPRPELPLKGKSEPVALFAPRPRNEKGRPRAPLHTSASARS